VCLNQGPGNGGGARLYGVAAGLETLLTEKWGAPLYTRVPDTETLIRDFDFGGTK